MFFIGWVGYGYSMQHLIGLASSLGTAEQRVTTFQRKMDCGLLSHIIGNCTSAEKCTKQTFLALSELEKCSCSIHSWLLLSLQYYAVYNSGNNGCVWKIVGGLQERSYPQIWRYWVCLSGNERNKKLTLETSFFFWELGFYKGMIFEPFQFWTSKICF